MSLATQAEIEPAPEIDAATAAPKRSWWRDLPFLLVVAVVLALVIKAFFVQAFFIPSGSMEKTLHGCEGCQGDRVLVNKILYDVRGVHRGEIVVFDGKTTDFPPETQPTPASNGLIEGLRGIQRFLGLGAPGERDYIKRVIGLPGDTVQCCTDGHVVVNGRVLNEPYIFEDDHKAFCAPGPDSLDQDAPATEDQCDAFAKPFVVPPKRLFVLGDHRGQSADSRYHGTIPIGSVIGRAFVKVWPITRWGLLPVPKTFTTTATTASTATTALPAAQGPLTADVSQPVAGVGDPSVALAAAIALPAALMRRRRITRRTRRQRVRIKTATDACIDTRVDL